MYIHTYIHKQYIYIYIYSCLFVYLFICLFIHTNIYIYIYIYQSAASPRPFSTPRSRFAQAQLSLVAAGTADFHTEIQVPGDLIQGYCYHYDYHDYH